MTDNPNQQLSKGEKLVIKDLEKIYSESPNLYYVVEEEGHIVRIDLHHGGDMEPEVDMGRFPESFKQLKWLRELKIRDNDLWELPDWLGELVSLQELMLNDNPIKSFPESIGNLTALRELSKSHQRVAKWSDHRVIQLPESFGDLKSLEILDLGDNKLTSSLNLLEN